MRTMESYDDFKDYNAIERLAHQQLMNAGNFLRAVETKYTVSVYASMGWELLVNDQFLGMQKPSRCSTLEALVVFLPERLYNHSVDEPLVDKPSAGKPLANYNFAGRIVAPV